MGPRSACGYGVWPAQAPGGGIGPGVTTEFACFGCGPGRAPSSAAVSEHGENAWPCKPRCGVLACGIRCIQRLTPHAAAGNAVYMFGGQSDRYLSDMWVLEGNSTAGMFGSSVGPCHWAALNIAWCVVPCPVLNAGLESLSCPVWFDLRIVHGVLMFLAWAVFLPAGVTIARFGRAAGWFPWHRGLQVSGVCLSTAGLAVAILMVRGSCERSWPPLHRFDRRRFWQAQVGAGKFAAVPHSIIGLVVAVIGLQQPANACCRPHPEPRTIKRIAFVRASAGERARKQQVVVDTSL